MSWKKSVFVALFVILFELAGISVRLKDDLDAEDFITVLVLLKSPFAGVDSEQLKIIQD